MSTFFVWEIKRNVSVVRLILAIRSSGPPASLFPAWRTSLLISLSFGCIYGNLQYLCKSTGRWGSINWIFPAGWSDIPHFTCQHGRNSVLFWRPRHFEGTLATVLARSDAAWLFLMGISERESLPNKPRTIDALKANITEEIQAVTADVLARAFQNMARRVQSCLDANGENFQHMLWCRHISYTTRYVRFKFRCNILISGKIIKEMPGSVASGTHCSTVQNTFQTVRNPDGRHMGDAHKENQKTWTINKQISPSAESQTN